MAGKDKKIKIALIGNQNSGKTSLFNRIVGANQKIGNWAGVTIEKYEGVKKYKNLEFHFVDLPGIYSLTPYTPEEKIARDYLFVTKPDVIINVLDSTNLDRNLYLTTQLLELQRPFIVVLNMYDELKRGGVKIDVPELSRLFGLEFLPISARTGLGIDRLLVRIAELALQPVDPLPTKFSHYPDIENEIKMIQSVLCQDDKLACLYPCRWLALRLLEGDERVYQLLNERPLRIKVEPLLRASIERLEKHFEQDMRTTIVESRYAFIRGALHETMTVGKKANAVSHFIDDLLINRIMGLPIFFGIMWLLFQLTFSLGQVPMGWLEQCFKELAQLIGSFVPNGLIKSLLIDGIIAGVGGVLVFVPNILILFMGISFLEGTGYMARAAFVVDKAMHRIGLHGRSFIPMILGFGCTVPAFLSCRTLKDRADRLTTMLVLPFISCSAKLPVYVLLIGAFFPKHNAGNLLFGIYFFGIILAAIMAKLLKVFIFRGVSEPFVMELPPYRMPSLKNILIHTWEKAGLYLRKAGTVLLFFAVVIWFMTNFPASPQVDQKYGTKIQMITYNRSFSERQRDQQISALKNLQASEQLSYSLAGRLGKLIEPAIKPLGFNWEIGVALVSGFAAKEVVVSTLSTIYAQHGEDSTLNSLRQSSSFSPLVALSLMIFVLLYVPCIAATTVFHKEVNNWHWTWFYLFFTTGTAYLSSFAVFQLGKLLGY